MKPSKYGGFERMMVQEAAIAADRGHEIHFIWEKRPIEAVEKDLVAYGARCVVKPAIGNRLGFLKWMVSYLKDNRIDVMHSHFEPASMLSLAAARWARTPVAFCTVHTGLGGYIAGGGIPLRVRFNARVRSLLAMRIFAVADSTRKEFASLGSRKVRLHYLGVVHNPPSREPQEIRRELGLGADDRVLVCVARHDPVKGLDVLLRSLADLVKRHENLKLVQIGSGVPDETQKLKKLCAELSMDDHLIWTGIRNDVPDLLSIGDIYVQSSRSEGLPLGICEAMSLGLPVVASRTDGTPEAVVDHSTGILVTPEATAELTEAIDSLLCGEQMRRQMGDNGRRRAQERFDLRRQSLRMIRKYEKAYDLVKRHRGSPCAG